MRGVILAAFLRTDLALLLVVATGVLAAAAVSVAARDLGLAAVLLPAPVVPLVLEGLTALASAEPAHFGPARAVIAVVYARF
jgi:hypothetical protein